MDINQDIIRLGRTAIDPLKFAIQNIRFESFASDQSLRKRLAPAREGKAIWVLRAYLSSDEGNITRPGHFLSRHNKVHCHKTHQGTKIAEEIWTIFNREIEPRYKAASVYNIQIAELPPAQEIKMHTDEGILKHSHRVHIPIITNEGVEFRVRKNRYQFEEGEIFELNNQYPHGVVNNGLEARFHLICDLLPHTSGSVERHLSESDQIAAMNKDLGISSI